MQLTNLPTDLIESLISKVCRKNFTFSELILTMINNDNFRVQLFNLQVDLIGSDSLSFNKNETLLDSLLFDDDKMIEKLEKLIIDGWITIKLFISSDTKKFGVLFKYSETVEYVCNPKIVGIDQCSTKLQYSFNYPISITINVKMSMEFEPALEYLETLVKRGKPLKKYEFDFKSIHKINIANPKCVDNMLMKYEKFQNFLKTHKIKVNNFEVELTIIFTGAIKVDILKKLFSSVYFFKKIKKVILYNDTVGQYYFESDFIREFEYLEILDIQSLNYFHCGILGSLKSMKYLKRVTFSYADVDHSWLNKCLPDCIESIRILQAYHHSISHILFKVPTSLKILEIEIRQSYRKKAKFAEFDFTNAVNLSRIYLINHSSQDRTLGLYENVASVEGLKKVPKSLRYLIHVDHNLNRRVYNMNLMGIDMTGIYSNINIRNDKNLRLVRH